MNPNKIIDTIKNELQATNIEYKFLDRENNFKEISLKWKIKCLLLVKTMV